MDFDQRLILVTGAGSGIGRATALALANANARLLLLGRHVPALESIFDDVVAAGAPEPSILPLDLEGASAADYAQIALAVEQQFGSLYALVHNAAELGERVPFEHLSRGNLATGDASQLRGGNPTDARLIASPQGKPP
jgi:NAD(P)-dependent dehydrogenase (short-subunit alcohol dehydrogenase family)